jgi:hypothetical protein
VAVAVIAPVGVAALASGNEAVAVSNAVDEARNHKGSVESLACRTSWTQRQWRIVVGLASQDPP